MLVKFYIFALRVSKECLDQVQSSGVSLKCYTSRMSEPELPAWTLPATETPTQRSAPLYGIYRSPALGLHADRNPNQIEKIQLGPLWPEGESTFDGRRNSTNDWINVPEYLLNKVSTGTNTGSITMKRCRELEVTSIMSKLKCQFQPPFMKLTGEKKTAPRPKLYLLIKFFITKCTKHVVPSPTFNCAIAHESEHLNPNHFFVCANIRLSSVRHQIFNMSRDSVPEKVSWQRRMPDQY